jgi:hypothetical protein
MNTYIHLNLHGFDTIADRILDHSKFIVQCNYPDKSVYFWGIDREPFKEAFKSMEFAAVAIWKRKGLTVDTNQSNYI